MKLISLKRSTRLSIDWQNVAGLVTACGARVATSPSLRARSPLMPGDAVVANALEEANSHA